MSTEFLNLYLDRFQHLRRNQNRSGEFAPHKPILLLSILDEIERGTIRRNLIEITPELVATFHAYWRALVPDGQWQARMVYPFRYLTTDGVWSLVRGDDIVTSGELGNVTSVGALQSLIDGGCFDPELWALLQHAEHRSLFRQCLMSTYFGTATALLGVRLPVSPIDYEIQRLIDEADARFRRKVAESTLNQDGYFVRHALFPRVIREMYQHSCAVCTLDTRIAGTTSVVDAAHIMPFRTSRNDDPRNGIALCKNHHWGFDRGYFTISPEYQIVVSPRLQGSRGYVVPGSRIRLPQDPRLVPAAEALLWHRQSVFVRG